MSTLSPFVFWAQDESNVYLKIDLKDVKNPSIKLEEKKLHFQSKGVGAQGLNDYQFILNLYEKVNTNKSNYKITDNRVNLTINKCEKSWWPRLIFQLQKPVWLKIDYDRFKTEDMDDNDVNEIHDIRNDYPYLYDKLQKEECGYKKEDLKKVYLSIYNLFMFIGFLYVALILSLLYWRDGYKSFAIIYQHVGQAVCLLQLLQLLEILHPLFGYVKGGILTPALQICGRLIILFAMLENEPRIQKMPVVFYLFMTWSTSEIIRYPYYIIQLLKREIYILRWIRYTAWMILYPIGFICETVIIFRNIIFFDQSGKWTINIPYIDFNLKFASILRIYMLFCMAPVMYFLMRHMYKIRQQKIPSIKNKKSKIKSKVN